MKKMTCVAFVLALALSLTACGTGEQEQTSVESQDISSESSVDAVDEETSQAPENSESIRVTTIQARRNSGSKVWYEVAYRQEGSEESQIGYMDLSGVISSVEPKGSFESKPSGGSSFVLYDADGNETYSNNEGFWQILWGTEDGVYIAQELRSGLDESATYIGLMDSTGNWMSDSPVNLTELTESGQLIMAGAAEDLGEGMLSAYCTKNHGNYLLLFNTETESIIPIEDVWNHYLHFYDGTMIFQHWDGGSSGGHKGEICSIDKTGNITVLPTEGELLATGENGFLTDANGLSFYNRSGELLWSFSDYELSVTPSLYENMIFAGFTGADGNTYKGCLSQESGTLVYEPVKAEGPTSGHVLLNTTGENCFIDLLTGETIVTTEDFEPEDIEYSSDGLFIIHYVGDNGVSYLFYDSEGNPVQPVLSGN